MDEILVEADPGGSRPAILGLGSEFVVIWIDSRSNLKGARFNASGDKVGEFQVNTTPEIFGLHALVGFGFGEQGGFVVGWIAFAAAKVLLRRFTKKGTRKGGEIRVGAVGVFAYLELVRGLAITELTA